VTAPRLGAVPGAAGVRFSAFLDPEKKCSVRLFDAAGRASRTLPLEALGDGYFSSEVTGAAVGDLYKLVVDGQEWPDPYARFLPQGVHGPARVEASSYVFEHAAPAVRPLSQHVIYELHVGTFTPEGTYAAAAQRLSYLAELGVTTLELMPISSFPGQRGWGYDGVAHFAPYAPYGEPDELRRFIDAAHGHGLAVLLDVVYNHFGPSGNYLGCYSQRYFTSEYHTPWGEAPRFGDTPMRRYVLDNALYWLKEFRFDGLRLDATHAIVDPSPKHVLQELAERVRERVPQATLIVEDERNEPELVTKLGYDAIWADDFHHQLRVTLTGERDGYYGGYTPGVEGIARSIERGWLYEGQPSIGSGKPRGKAASALDAQAFVYCIQNHDQIGNRALGERLHHDVTLDAYCLASTLLLFLPMTPLLFMGQEWAASTPFLYFTDHDAELGAQVTAGRRREFAHFAAFAEPARQAAIPDPQLAATFERSKLLWQERGLEPHARVLSLYRELLALRRQHPVLAGSARRAYLTAVGEGDLLAVLRRGAPSQQPLLLLANFGQSSRLLSETGWRGQVTAQLFSSHGAVPAALEACALPALSAAVFQVTDAAL
jgi:maltooligosyltrehalose trehalohydrolase